jgi:anthranilate synthase component 2
MQCMNEAFGGTTVHAPVPMHGKTSAVHHDGAGLFEGVPQPLTVARYHSLAITGISEELRVNARSSDGCADGGPARASSAVWRPVSP